MKLWLWTYGGVMEENGGDYGRRERVSLYFSLIKFVSLSC